MNTQTQMQLYVDSIQASFEAFHRENPLVYQLLCLYARAARESGMRRYGINSIYERMRWAMDIDIRNGGDFKLNNNYRSRYARLIMEQEPDLANFFETRELRTD